MKPGKTTKYQWNKNKIISRALRLITINVIISCTFVILKIIKLIPWDWLIVMIPTVATGVLLLGLVIFEEFTDDGE